LLGFAFDGMPGPVKMGHVRLGELTAIIGANDVGKSRLVRTFATALAQGRVGNERVRFFAECNESEIPALFRAIEDWSENIRPTFRFAEDKGDREEADQDPIGSAVAAIAELQLDVKAETWQIICAALAGSRFFALEAARDCDSPAWTVDWCAPAADELDSDLRDALIEVRRRTKGRVDEEFAQPPFAPQPVVRLGVLPLSWLPRPVFLPVDTGDVAAGATATVAELAQFLEVFDSCESVLDLLKAGTVELDGARVFPESLQSRLLDSPEAPLPASVWIDDSDFGSTRVKQNAIRACELIASIATSLAPPYIRDRYWFQVSVTPEAVYSGRAPVKVRLAIRDDTPDQERERPEFIDHWGSAPFGFATDELADRYRIWTQLAILQALDIVATLTSDLRAIAEDVFFAGESVAFWHEIQAKSAQPRIEIDQSEREERRATDDAHIDERIAAERESLAERVTTFQTAVWTLQGGLGDRIAGTFTHPPHHARPRAPMFLVDEPERHLDPGAQRPLVAWLRDLVRQHATQALLTTHAVAVINQADAIAYVARPATGDASVTACTNEELTALGKIAADLGLNRGELLARESVFLFVEGLSDKYVLEGLFADRLRRIGVAVFPVHGATQLPQVVDSQILMSYSTATVAVLLDNLEEREIEKLLTDPQHREGASHGDTEEQAVAKLFREAARHRRMPEVLGIPVKDIFFLLDEDAIRETFREQRRTAQPLPPDNPPPSYPDYPDHASAQAEFAGSSLGPEWTGRRWKRFLDERYGIPFDDVSWYRRVADRMRSAGALPEELVSAIDRLELLALAVV
jgi:energy-coupling factor transporter ATP-binding protein EcfA2